ncbi:hypothetical protein HMPREF1475_00472 [Hoylesella oralis HGA0225]|nr:hypothetical protein HMPREF1475_00472 [Hoylesella oralis HGA0225]SHF63615.1 hypothetical protein SAMN05444288_1156 [Hoylesella oralis]
MYGSVFTEPYFVIPDIFYLFSCIFKIYCVPLYPYLLYFNFFFSILESSREYKQ